jgi:uncharacterized Fe-S cluster protein YjdI
MKDVTKNYSNGEITVVWKPAQCIHSAKCWRGHEALPEVFNPTEKPWINPQGAATERIIAQIKQCPSGALSYRYNDERALQNPESVTTETRVEVVPNGPLLVYGNLTVRLKSGEAHTQKKVTAFCRCGKSANKPFCDGTHIQAGFSDE